jgi:hypothetical protein
VQTKTDYQTLVEQKKDSSPGGVDAVFIPISDKWALKMFRSERTRSFSYLTQKRCSEHGLAPLVGEKVDIQDGEYKYGFICEIVETIVPEDVVVRAKYANEKKNGHWSTSLNNEWNEIEDDDRLQDELRNLIEQYEDLGFSPSDMHAGNLGYLYNEDGERQLICIDFGHWD